MATIKEKVTEDINIVSFSGAASPRPPKEKRAKAPIRKTSGSRARGSRQTVAAPAPTHEEIAIRAYFISQRREQAGLPGSPVQDWLDAERELRDEWAKRRG